MGRRGGVPGAQPLRAVGVRAAGLGGGGWLWLLGARPAPAGSLRLPLVLQPLPGMVQADGRVWCV